MMFTITICDDIDTNVDILYEMTRRYVSERHLNSLIKSFTDPIEVLNSTPSDVYLLDMLMPHLNGKDLAIRILERYPSAKIVFISAESGKALGTHEYAIDYLLKPVDYAILARVLDKVVSSIREEIFIAKTPMGDQRIKYADLLYATCIDRAIEYYLTNGEVIRSICIRGKASEILEPLAQHEGMIFLPPTLLVNLTRVDIIDGAKLMFKYDCVPTYVYCAKKWAKEVRLRWGEIIGEFDNRKAKTDV